MIEHFELHRCIDDVITINKWRSRLNLVKQVRVITHLFELHEHIEELDSILRTHSIDSGNISSDDFFVKLLLKLSETNKHVDFFLGWQIMLNIYLKSPQHEWLE